MSVTYVDSNGQTPATRDSATIPIPNTPPNAADDIAVVSIYKENASDITPPDGTWTLKNSDTTNATSEGALFVFWKRLTANETGSWVFTWTGSVYSGSQVEIHRGCTTTGDPFYSSTILRTANNAGSTVGASVSSVLNGMAISFASTWALAPRTFTAPATWTRSEQHASMATGYKEGMAGGSTGTITWTGSANDYYQMFLGVLRPPSTGIIVSAIIGGEKKAATLYAVIGGEKKSAQGYVIDGGVRK